MCRPTAWSLAAFAAAALVGGSACAPANPAENWTCDFDASESRPLSERDATPGPDGAWPASVCQDTCGPPARSCSFVSLDGGEPGAICPVCTF
jgi:hypothetical protein